MSFLRTTSKLALGALLLGACDSAPVEPPSRQSDPAFSRSGGERMVEEYVYDLTGSAFSFACNAAGEPIDPEDGEEILLEGKVVERVTIREDAMGRSTFKLKIMPVGLHGVSALTGEPFRVVESGRATYHESELVLSGNYKFVQKLVGKDTGRSFKLVWGGSYRVLTDGSLERDRYFERVVCKA